MYVRREVSADREAVLELVGRAFSGAVDPPTEVQLTRELFACDEYLPEFSLVAEIDGAVAGFVIGTRGWVGDHPAIGLGPLAVDPASQNAGVGSALVHSVIGAADATGESTLVLLGDPAYYSRFGFVRADTVGVESPDPAWGVHFQARHLASWTPAITGRFRYSSPFGDLG